MKVSLNWLKEYVKVKGSPELLAEALTMAGLEVKKMDRVGDDTIFETEITTNRSDWLSHIGVARELHAITGHSFSKPKIVIKKHPKTEHAFKIATPNKDLCPYYSATLLEDVVWDKTPDFMRKRLEACGIRSINFIVDITNYVLLEYGQPLHAFDADKLSGDISARRAVEGEKLTAIDGNVYSLSKDDLVIADSKGPVAIGGVMGGKDSEVTNQTRNILLESAFFSPASVRRTARKLNLSSESSYRFERRVDPLGVDEARERAVFLIAQHAKIGKITLFKNGTLPVKPVKISFPYSEVKRLLGTDIPQAKAKTYLTRLGLKITDAAKKWSVSVPSFRSEDLTRPADLVEEIARLYGYDKIPETLPLTVPLEPYAEPILILEEKARHLCSSLGFSEAITFSLVDPNLYDRLNLYKNERVRLINPQNKELNLMRPSLISGLAQSVQRNLYAGEENVALFEIGNRYLAEDEKNLPDEDRSLGLILSGESTGGWLDKKRAAGFYDLKGAIETLIRRLGIHSFEEESSESPLYKKDQGIAVSIEGLTLGTYGTLSDAARKMYDMDKAVFYGEFSLRNILKAAKSKRVVKEIPKFPSSPRDLTLICDDSLKSIAIVRCIQGFVGELAPKIEVLDSFRGGKIPQGKKSLTFRIYYQAKDRTLENEFVNKFHFSLIDELNKSFGTELQKAKTS